jgi:hypothetical protein
VSLIELVKMFVHTVNKIIPVFLFLFLTVSVRSCPREAMIFNEGGWFLCVSSSYHIPGFSLTLSTQPRIFCICKMKNHPVMDNLCYRWVLSMMENQLSQFTHLLVVSISFLILSLTLMKYLWILSLIFGSYKGYLMIKEN